MGNMAAFDPARIKDFYNPFEADVVGAQQGSFDRQRQLAQQSGAQQSTRDGTFGGDRSAILQAELMGGVNRSEAETLSQLRAAGYSDAMGQAVTEYLGRHQILGNLAGANAQAGATVGAASIGAQQRYASDQLNALLNASQFDIGTRLQAGMANQDAHAQGYGLNLQNNAQGLQGMLGVNDANLSRAGTMAGLGEMRRNAAIQQGQLPLENWLRGIPALAGALGPTGSTTNQSERTQESGGQNLLGQLLGGALTIGGSLIGGPVGGAVGGALSGLLGGGGGTGGRRVNPNVFAGWQNGRL